MYISEPVLLRSVNFLSVFLREFVGLSTSFCLFTYVPINTHILIKVHSHVGILHTSKISWVLDSFCMEICGTIWITLFIYLCTYKYTHTRVHSHVGISYTSKISQLFDSFSTVVFGTIYIILFIYFCNTY